VLYTNSMNTVEAPTLKAVDRCDTGCGAAAQVLLEGNGGQLQFCSHHYQAQEPALAAWAQVISDQREG